MEPGTRQYLYVTNSVFGLPIRMFLIVAVLQRFLCSVRCRMHSLETEQSFQEKTAERKLRILNGTSDHSRLIGIVFARYHSPFVQKEVLPHLEYWDHRSALHTHFYFAGYRTLRDEDKDAGQVAVEIPGFNQRWTYSDSDFNKQRRWLEQTSTWQYSGDTELLLLNCHYGDQEPIEYGRRETDFSSVVCCRLEIMKDDKAFVSVSELFERIFRFSESSVNTNPTWGFSDFAGLSAAGSTLKQALLATLPASIAAEYQKAEHFAVRDYLEKGQPRSYVKSRRERAAGNSK